MPITKKGKEAIVAKLKDKIKRAKIIIFANFSAIKVVELTKLRKLVQGIGGELVVAKKTLFGRALREAYPRESIDVDSIAGEVIFAFGYDDELLLSKTLVQSTKVSKSIKILNGLLGPRVLLYDEVIGLANLPERPQLLSQLMATLQAPLRNLSILLKVELIQVITILTQINKK